MYENCDPILADEVNRRVGILCNLGGRLSCYAVPEVVDTIRVPVVECDKREPFLRYDRPLYDTTPVHVDGDGVDDSSVDEGPKNFLGGEGHALGLTIGLDDMVFL